MWKVKARGEQSRREYVYYIRMSVRAHKKNVVNRAHVEHEAALVTGSEGEQQMREDLVTRPGTYSVEWVGRNPAPSIPDDLTVEDLELILLVAAPTTNPAMAELFGVPEHVIQSRLRSLMRRCNVRNRAHLVATACRAGIQVLPEDGHNLALEEGER